MQKKAIQCELYNYKVYKAQLENIHLEIDRIKAEYQGIKGMSYDNVGGGGTNEIGRAVENEVLKKDERITTLNKKKEYVEYLIKRIDNAMKPLTELERKVIEERYFNQQDFYDVAELLGYSYQWCRMQDRNALSKLGLSMN